MPCAAAAAAAVLTVVLLCVLFGCMVRFIITVDGGGDAASLWQFMAIVVYNRHSS